MKYKTYLKAAILLFFSLSAWASTTTLTGTIVDAQGNPLNGVLTMRLPVPAQDQTTNVAVAPVLVTFNLVNGVITGGAPLYDVANLQPQGLYYSARGYDTTGALQFYGNYVVTGASFNLGAATPTSITTSNVSYVLPIFPNQTNQFTAAQQFVTITSASSPDAASGFIRAASGDQVCWHSAAAGSDSCIGDAFQGGLDYTSFSAQGGILVNAGFITSGLGANIVISPTAAPASSGPNVGLTAGSATGTNLNGGNVNLAPGAKNGSGTNGAVQVFLGMGGTGTGFQHKRLASCTTGNTAGNTCATTITWNNTFFDTNYTAVCTIDSVTNVPYVLSTGSKSTTQVVVTIATLTNAAASGTLNCIGVHD